MLAEIFLVIAIILQLGAAAVAFSLIRVTGRALAWICVSIALFLMAVRRAIPLFHALAGSGTAADPLNEFLGMVLSGFMLCGVALIGPIFRRIFESERELAESERRFRSYFELPIVGFATLSSDLRWMTVNDRLCDLLGLTREEVIGRPVTESSLLEDAALEATKDRDIHDGRVEGYVLDKRLARKDGKPPLWVNEAVRCIRDADGGISYYVAIIQDISERKAFEESLRGSVREKETLLRELHHRTKNNMQVICSLLNLECSQAADPRLAEEFHEIEDRIQSMSLVHEKLYRSQDLSTIELSDYVKDLTALLVRGHASSVANIRLRMELDPVHVPVDIAIPCGLILNELVSNCFKHAFPGGREGTITVRLSAGQGGAVSLSVEDDGAGSQAAFEGRVGERMGLKTARVLAEQLGGSLRFSFGSGVGCRLDFRAGEVLGQAQVLGA